MVPGGALVLLWLSRRINDKMGLYALPVLCGAAFVGLVRNVKAVPAYRLENKHTALYTRTERTRPSVRCRIWHLLVPARWVLAGLVLACLRRAAAASPVLPCQHGAAAALAVLAVLLCYAFPGDMLPHTACGSTCPEPAYLPWACCNGMCFPCGDPAYILPAARRVAPNGALFPACPASPSLHYLPAFCCSAVCLTFNAVSFSLFYRLPGGAVLCGKDYLLLRHSAGGGQDGGHRFRRG